MKISAVIITKNEERNIGRCLESIIKIADEIIVIDSMSTDNTKQIVESYPNTRFEQREWMGYSQTKNYGNNLANGDYILSLDADEALSPNLQLKIENIKNNLLTGVFSFNRLTNYCGQWIRFCGWYPDTKIRLFPKTILWNDNPVHEDLDLPANLKVQHLDGDLYHYSYYKISEHIERCNTYSDLAAIKVMSSNKNHLIAKAIFNSWFKFIKSYILKMGFRDGFYGFCICVVSALEVFLKYAKAEQLRQVK